MILSIEKYPNSKFLTKRAAPVGVREDVWQYVQDMVDTLNASPALGLAANQMGILKRIVVVDIHKTGYPITLINPVITYREGSVTSLEGSVSFPWAFAEVRRAKKITVSAKSLEGHTVEIHAAGDLAACIQHLIDQLDGKVFLDGKVKA